MIRLKVAWNAHIPNYKVQITGYDLTCSTSSLICSEIPTKQAIVLIRCLNRNKGNAQTIYVNSK